MYPQHLPSVQIRNSNTVPVEFDYEIIYHCDILLTNTAVGFAELFPYVERSPCLTSRHFSLHVEKGIIVCWFSAAILPDDCQYSREIYVPGPSSLMILMALIIRDC
jgi:hypothetical protein